MTTLRLLIELDYDESTMHGDDTEAREWFFNYVLREGLVLHSNEIGDEVGSVKILQIKWVS